MVYNVTRYINKHEMEDNKMLNKAIIIATKAHEGQVDKGGQAYILHPLRVMLSTKNVTERICGVLHDVVEDTDITLDYLREQGFTEEVISVVDALTRRDDESYDEFISRIIGTSELACKVKLADLKDNMDLSRISNPSEKDYERIDKYSKATKRLMGALTNL